MRAAERDKAAHADTGACLEEAAEEETALAEAEHVDGTGLGGEDGVRGQSVTDGRDLVRQGAEEGGALVGGAVVAEGYNVHFCARVDYLEEVGNIGQAVVVEAVAQAVPEDYWEWGGGG